MPRITCHRYDGTDHARAAAVRAEDRPRYLAASGWRQVGADTWTTPGRSAVYSTAAAVREVLREEAR